MWNPEDVDAYRHHARLIMVTVLSLNFRPSDNPPKFGIQTVSRNAHEHCFNLNFQRTTSAFVLTALKFNR